LILTYDCRYMLMDQYYTYLKETDFGRRNTHLGRLVVIIIVSNKSFETISRKKGGIFLRRISENE